MPVRLTGPDGRRTVDLTGLRPLPPVGTTILAAVTNPLLLDPVELGVLIRVGRLLPSSPSHARR
ncbi:MAG: hypothetical protein JOY78_09725 [Pseudonocardia sp.]|nr:hypothetical protein [Pseudonocardia sp.]